MKERRWERGRELESGKGGMESGEEEGKASSENLNERKGGKEIKTEEKDKN